MKTLLLSLLLFTSACDGRTGETLKNAPKILQTLGFTVKTDVSRDEFHGCVTYLVTRKEDSLCQTYSMEAFSDSNSIIIYNIKCVDPIK